MRYIFFLATVVACQLLAADLTLTCDHTNAVYAVGEPIKFTAEAIGEKAKGVELWMTVTRLKGSVLAKTNGTDNLTLMVTGDKPGFLCCTVGSVDKSKKLWMQWHVAVSPEKIVSKTPDPEDFDAFWRESFERYDQDYPSDITLKPYKPWTNEKVEAFEVSVGVPGGQRVYGWLVKPKEVKGRAPAYVQVPGAGFGKWTFNPPASYRAPKGGVVLFLNVLRLPLDVGFDAYTQATVQLRKEIKDANPVTNGFYWYANATNREDYFYHRTILGVVRLVSWLHKQPYVDPERLYYEGTSQGGGFGLMLCALYPHFRYAAIYVPALTGHYEYLDNEPSGWPRVIEHYRHHAPKSADAVKQAMAYYDGVNFARRIKCPVDMAVGFADTVCHPNAVYGAFNALATKEKRMTHGLGMGHSVHGWVYQKLDAEKFDRETRGTR